MVEQRFCKPLVVGSNPTAGSVPLVILKRQKELLTYSLKFFTHIIMKNTLRVLIVTAIALASPLAMADTGSKGSSSDAVADEALAVPDLLFARPAGLAGTTIGFAAFVVVSPSVAMAECVDEAWDTLVITPGEWTFTRSLGDFGDK